MVRMQVAIEPAEAMLMPVLLNEAVKLCDEAVAVSRTLPVNPRLESVMVAVAVPPAKTAGGEDWPARTVKSEETLMLIVTV